MQRIQDFWDPALLAGPRRRECPDCGARLIRRTSIKQSPLCREIFYQCDYPLCGAGFKGYEEIVYRLGGGGNPNPMVNLPTSPSQKHAGGCPPGVAREKKDCCPKCGERLRKHVIETDTLNRYVVYVECARPVCGYSLTGSVSLKANKKG
jgi:hypothetical protein